LNIFIPINCKQRSTFLHLTNSINVSILLFYFCFLQIFIFCKHRNRQDFLHFLQYW
jgi:hypothetical protein